MVVVPMVTVKVDRVEMVMDMVAVIEDGAESV